MTKTTKKVIHILYMVLAATLFEVFFLLCLRHFYREWSVALYFSVLVTGSLANLAILITDIVCCILNKEVHYAQLYYSVLSDRFFSNIFLYSCTDGILRYYS